MRIKAELKKKFKYLSYEAVEEEISKTTDPKYLKNVKYVWMTIADGSNIKIYKQKKRVAYADYKSGFYYISPHECIV